MTSLKDIVCCKCGCLTKFSNGIVAGLERLFYKLGGFVGRHPLKTMAVCIVVCGLMGIGLIKWHEENDYVKVWLPRGSRMKGEWEWVQANFPERIRFESVVVEDENVLSRKSINAMLDIFETAQGFQTENDENITCFCVKSGPLCRVSGLLELWSYNRNVINNLTDEDIYNKVNEETLISPLFQNEMNLEKLLGHITRDNSGNITRAKATTMFWFLERNKTTDRSTRDWEKQLINYVNDMGHPHLDNLYIYTARTFDDEAMGALNSDLNLLTIGFSLVFIYLSISIGKFSLIHHKVLLAAAGLFSIGLSIIFTYGFGFMTGIMFGPIHQIMPFMLLGIGVDDIFVIMESLNHLSDKEKALPVDGRIAYTMKHAGVSITVTSVTDIVAFAIGSSTVIPSLSTFCIYAAIGVFALYVLQSTFFVACLVLDERRRDSRRDACVLCYTHQDSYKPNEYYTFSIQHQVMKNVWGPALTKTPVKVIVILVTVGLTSLNTWSFIQLKHDFDPSMYLPTDSYSQKYVEADRKYFPDDGAFVQLYCSGTDYANNVDRLLQLYEDIRQKPTVQGTTVNFWLDSYHRWLNSSAESSMHVPYEAFNIDHVPSIPSPSSNKDLREDITSATKDPLQHLLPANKSLPGTVYDLSASDTAVNVSSDTDSNTADDPRSASSSQSSVSSNSLLETSSDSVTSTQSVTEKSNSFSILGLGSVNIPIFGHLATFWNSPEGSLDSFPDEVSNPTNNSEPSEYTSNNSSQLDLGNTSSSQFLGLGSQDIPFLASLAMFLQTPQGRVYFGSIKFDNITSPTKIVGSMLTFRHVKCSTSKCNIDAMTDMRELVDAFSFRGGRGTCFVYSNPQYMFNETNKVLKMELIRNLALAAVCVFFVTLILITNIWTSTLVFIGVVCTVIDVAGTMYFWDISVDTASSVILILCFGLAVDYSAHIGHSFMTNTGSKNERLQRTLVSMGPAVFSGGFSTFLAFLLLVNSSSYGFTLFFKIFTSVVIFGLFHGLAFLPVILSVVGPPPYETQSFHTPPPSPTGNGNVNGFVVTNGNTKDINGEAVALRDLHTVEFGGVITPNGHLCRSVSEGDLEDDPTQKLNENNPRYSGSYYEQLSNGSLVQIPFPGPH